MKRDYTAYLGKQLHYTLCLHKSRISYTVHSANENVPILLDIKQHK